MENQPELLDWVITEVENGDRNGATNITVETIMYNSLISDTPSEYSIQEVQKALTFLHQSGYLNQHIPEKKGNLIEQRPSYTLTKVGSKFLHDGGFKRKKLTEESYARTEATRKEFADKLVSVQLEAAEKENKKRELEIEFIQESRQSLKQQKKLGWIAVSASVASLLFLFISTIQTCNSTSDKELKGIREELRMLHESPRLHK